MAKDPRIWAKFAVDMPDNPKILPLSDAAFRCLIEMTMYSRRMLTDGFVASRLAVAKWGLDVLEELCENDPFKPSLSRVSEGGLEGFQIRDFAEHQELRADIEARSRRNKANGSKGGQARAKQVAKQPAKRKSSETQAETETETESNKPLNPPLKGGERKGSRLPDGWMPSREDIAAVAADCPGFDTQREHKNFTEYWLSKTGQGAVKLNWSMTWRTWMRRAYDRLPANQKPTQTRKVKRFNDEDD